jgi:uncharacterized protein YjiK
MVVAGDRVHDANHPKGFPRGFQSSRFYAAGEEEPKMAFDRRASEADGHVRAVCKQARQIMVRKVSTEIVDPERRVEAVLSACTGLIVALTQDDDELFRATMHSIAAERGGRL